MSGDKETTSEQSSSVHDGARYDEVYPLGYRPEEGSSWSSEREPSAHSLVDEEEDYDGKVDEDGYNEGEGENEGEYEGEDDENESEGDERALKGGKFRKLKGWSHLSFHPSGDMDSQRLQADNDN